MRIEREGWCASYFAYNSKDHPYAEIRISRDETRLYCIATRRDQEGFFVSLRTGDLEGLEDIGPFPTFEAAAVCFKTMPTEENRHANMWG